MKSALILAAGKGTRLGDLANNKPKGFLEINGVSLIERSIINLRRAGFENIVIVTGFLHKCYEELAERLDVKCVYNDLYDKYGSAHSLFVGMKAMNEDFILLESDLLYEYRMLTVLSSTNCILTSDITNAGDDVFVIKKNGTVDVITKGLDAVHKTDEVLVGISSFSIKDVQHILIPFYEGVFDSNTEVSKRLEYEQLLVFAKTLMPFKTKKTNFAWCEIDNAEHYQRAITKILPSL